MCFHFVRVANIGLGITYISKVTRRAYIDKNNRCITKELGPRSMYRPIEGDPYSYRTGEVF